LSSEEARRRLADYGPNALPRDGARNLLAMAVDVLKEPMFVLLIVAASIYMALGDFGEGVLLLGAAIVGIGLGVAQERRTERALAALRDLSSPRALVLRDGVPKRVAGPEIVPGDVMILAEGDRVAADGRLFDAQDFEVDESLLTGESIPAPRFVAESDPKAALVHAGSLVVRGHGRALVTATGARSELGRIGASLVNVEPETTPLRRRTADLTKAFATMGLGLSVVMALIVGFGQGNLLDGILAGIVLAMALLPEEFPVILATFLALGAFRLSKIGVLARKGSAIESLGAMTALCVDKTGTLTVNRMRVVAVVAGSRESAVGPADDLSQEAKSVIAAAALACESDAFDPMEKAMIGLAMERGVAPPRDWRLAREFEKSATFLAMAHVWRKPDGASIGAAKGAPEAIARLCRLDSSASSTIAAQVDSLARRGLRVLGVAGADAIDPAAADLGGVDDLGFRWLGLIALADPLRETVPAAIAACRNAGIRVIMVTGDHAVTARAIAGSAGLAEGAVTLGSDFARLDAIGRAEVAGRTSVFARMLPEQKLDLVRALAARGEVVGMTGDGVNDAPALKAAHVGVAMGERGSDVAREAALIVLIDDDFKDLVEAIAHGRRIGANIRRAMAYVLAIHVPIAGLALVPPMLGLPLVLLPAHVVFLELVIDPVAALAFEAEPGDPDIMLAPPVAPDAPLIGRSAALIVALQGLSILAAAGLWLGLGSLQGLASDASRTLAFVALVAGNLGLVQTTRSWSRGALETATDRNPLLWGSAAAIVAALFVVVVVPDLAELFRFVMPPWPAMLGAIVTGFFSTAWFEAWKAIKRRRRA
jgi:Ca2+-transporting ATPase